ncbi:hypothetical protein GCM10025864_28640 [Luteimicrobium album]|uniref:SGNH domain-containing protein n=1 Tax=Luteimicrobium album TaxID=1054550 RepID=A0ABQ6I2W1_9MICO|nr:SGNH hydrolase domain-containing protein [Luteimicrobium album]GMA25105.1 hypothetical protein GCM10025864_28640 [Luteimicrobium album]
MILVGDSHARALLPAFVALAQEGKISVTAQLKATCAWTTGKMNYDDPERSRTCEQWKAQLGPWLVSQAKTTDLIVTTGYLKTISGDAERRVDDMAAAWRPLTKLGVPIVGIADNPYHTYLPYKCLAKLDVVQADSCAVSQKKAFPFPDPFKATAKVVPGAKSLDLTDFYCRDDVCPSVIGGVDVYRDNSHMTTTFTKTLSPYIWRGLQRLDVLN